MTTTLVATVGQKFTVTGMTCSHCEMRSPPSCRSSRA